MSKLLRSLTWFDKRNDEWVGEVRLRRIPLRQLQSLFRVSANNPMYDSFKVKPEHVEIIEKWTGVPLDLKKYDYFVEASTVTNPKPLAVTR
jgi:hypothetical protein